MTFNRKVVAIIEDEVDLSNVISELLNSVSLSPKVYSTAEEFLAQVTLDISCIVSDIRLPGMSGLLLQKKMQEESIQIPLIMISGHADVEISVQAMKNGARDFFTKPIKNQLLLDSIFSAIKDREVELSFLNAQSEYLARFNALTSRERSILQLTTDGLPSKCIADQLNICKNTVDVHRSKLMKKMQAKSLHDLVARTVYFTSKSENGFPFNT